VAGLVNTVINLVVKKMDLLTIEVTACFSRESLLSGVSLLGFVNHFFWKAPVRVSVLLNHRMKLLFSPDLKTKGCIRFPFSLLYIYPQCPR
jgi:hypothetical protein